MTTSRRSRQTSFVDGCEPQKKEPKRGYQGGPLRPSPLLPTPTVADTRDGTVFRAGHNGDIGGRKNVNLNHLVEGLGWTPDMDQTALQLGLSRAKKDYGTKGELLPTPRPCSGKRSGGVNSTEMLQSVERQGLWFTPTAGVTVGGTRDVALTEGMAEHFTRTGQGNIAEQVAAAVLLEGGFSPPGIPASRSPTPGSGPARMTPGTSGRGFSACLPASAPTVLRGFVWKMSEGTSAWGSTVCSLTWTTSATPQRRGLFLLRASARSTGATGSGLSDAGRIPTPQSRDYRTGGADRWENSQTEGDRSQNLNDWAAYQSERMWPTPRAGKTTDEEESAWTRRRERGDVSTPPLSLAVKMWPTPTVQDGKNAAGPSQWERNSDPLNVAVQRVGMWATPTTSSAATNAVSPSSKNRGRSNGQALAEQVSETTRTGQRLNPDFVERLMGFPEGWTILSPASGSDGSTACP